MEISTFLLIALGIFYLFYLYLINFCNNQAHENFSSSKNQSIIVYQQMCLDLHLKKPFDLVIYIVNFTSTNRNKILITMGIIMAAYGWSMHATTMKQAAIDLYTEIKITVTFPGQLKRLPLRWRLRQCTIQKRMLFASISAVLRRFNTLSNTAPEGNRTSLVEEPYTAVSVSYCAI